MTEELQIGPKQSVRILTSSPELLEVEARYGPGSAPPPRHLHPHHDESFAILEGRLDVEIDKRTEAFAAGQEFEVLRGRVHRMWNSGDIDSVVRWRSRPARASENWFRGLAALQEAAGGSDRPDLLGFAAHARANRDDFRLVLAGSPVLGGMVVGCLGGLGRVLGRGPSPNL